MHFTNEEDAEAHERLICLSTNKRITDENRMLYSKQEWLKSTEEMNGVFADLPQALSNTLEIADKVEFYDIDHAPIMPFFAIPEEFGTEEEYRSRITEQELFDEFTRDENGNVVLSQEEAEKKIKKLGGYDKLYRIKFEADYLKKLAYEGAAKRYGTPLSPELEERIKFELHIMKTMGFPRLLPYCARLYKRIARTPRRQRRPGPWFSRRFVRGLLPGYHPDRPHKIRPSVRAFSQPPTVSPSPISTSTSTMTAAHAHSNT